MKWVWFLVPASLIKQCGQGDMLVTMTSGIASEPVWQICAGVYVCHVLYHIKYFLKSRMGTWQVSN